MRLPNLILVILSVAFVSCDKGVCPHDIPFCLYMEEGNLDASGELISDYLESQGTNEQQAMENLVKWLACKSCVTSAEILCVSCVETLPAQSEVLMNVLQGQDTLRLVIDISMGEPFRFIRYH